MTRVFTEGFELGDLVGWCFGADGSIINVAISTLTKRSGAYSLYLGCISGTNGWAYRNIDGVSELYLRFGFYLDPAEVAGKRPQIYWQGGSLTSYITFSTACNCILLYINGVNVATGLSVLDLETWYLMEVHIKLSATVGEIDIKLDNKLEVDYDGNTGTGTVTSIKFYHSDGGLGEIGGAYFDDIAINDTAGGVDDGFCGDGKIIVMMPNDDSTPLELTPSAASDHHLLVDDKPKDSDTTYVEGSVIDEEDMYKLTACGLVDVDITRVWTEARVRKTAASDGMVALITKAAGGAEVSGGDVEIMTTYSIKVLGAEQLVNPVDSAVWEVADVNAIEIGPRTR